MNKLVGVEVIDAKIGSEEIGLSDDDSAELFSEVISFVLLN